MEIFPFPHPPASCISPIYGTVISIPNTLLPDPLFRPHSFLHFASVLILMPSITPPFLSSIISPHVSATVYNAPYNMEVSPPSTCMSLWRRAKWTTTTSLVLQPLANINHQSVPGTRTRACVTEDLDSIPDQGVARSTRAQYYTTICRTMLPAAQGHCSTIRRMMHNAVYLSVARPRGRLILVATWPIHDLIPTV